MTDNISLSGVPKDLHAWSELAEEWGISDDYDREKAVESASDTELEKLVERVGNAPDKLFEWLEGDESYSPNPSDGYVAFSCMVLAFESARIILEQRRRP